jgi:DDE superfamily endonuclease
MWCIPEISAEYVAAMEDVLDLYEAPYDEKRPMVCFDESPQQLIAEVRERIPAGCGRIASFDAEYRRNGVRNLMMISEPKRGLRKVLITKHRTRIEFAQSMKHIVSLYPEAEVIRVVLDNLNMHKTASLYEAFAPEEARAIARKLEFHYTRSTVAGSIWPRWSSPYGLAPVLPAVSPMKQACADALTPTSLNATESVNPSTGGSRSVMRVINCSDFIHQWPHD